ncbi:MAG: DUF3187 family protein [Syntrophaceae bacterium]|nr:DUF3187 family protein [Syntrophaceae bacterium]
MDNEMTRTAGFHTIAAVCFTILFAPSAAAATEIVPFESTNQSPLVQIYGLPGAGNAVVLPRGRTEVGLNVALSNNYAVNENSREDIILDGETTRFTVAARYGLFPGLEVGVKIPYISHSGGFLDGFIENYHGAFGFPNAGRDQAPQNRFLYRYRRDGVEKLRIDSSGSGIGDLLLTTALQLYQEEIQGMTLNAAIKLPTGDSDQLRGSGSTDFSLWLHERTGGAFSAGNWASYGSAGILFMREGKVLPDQQKRWVGFGTLGIGWAPLEWISFKVQADAHTPFFSDSDLKEIAANAVQLIVGGTISFSERTALDIGVSEDLIVNTSPDVVFYFTLRTRF